MAPSLPKEQRTIGVTIKFESFPEVTRERDVICHFQHEECQPGVIFKFNSWEGKGSKNEAHFPEGPAVPGVSLSAAAPRRWPSWSRGRAPKGLRAQLFTSQWENNILFYNSYGYTNASCPNISLNSLLPVPHAVKV